MPLRDRLALNEVYPTKTVKASFYVLQWTVLYCFALSCIVHTFITTRAAWTTHEHSRISEQCQPAWIAHKFITITIISLQCLNGFHTKRNSISGNCSRIIDVSINPEHFAHNPFWGPRVAGIIRQSSLSISITHWLSGTLSLSPIVYSSSRLVQHRVWMRAGHNAARESEITWLRLDDRPCVSRGQEVRKGELGYRKKKLMAVQLNCLKSDRPRGNAIGTSSISLHRGTTWG